MHSELICPKCRESLFVTLDEWGYTPWHLHCSNCHINIGANNIKNAVELIQKYNKPYTYIEYYLDNIQILYEEKELKIDKSNILLEE